MAISFSPAAPWRERLSAHIGHLFTDIPFEQRIAAAAQSGFVGVENPEPYGVPAPRMAQLLADSGLPYVQCGVFGDSASGEKGLAAQPGRRDDFRNYLHKSLDYAAAIGCGMVHVLSGNTPDGVAPEIAWNTYLDNLGQAADAAKSHGITIIVEAMSMPGYFVSSPLMVLEAVNAVGRDNLRMMFDVFHTTNIGLDAAETIRKGGPAIVHVHVADHPARNEPGSGSVDFAAVRLALTEIGYRGYIGCEYNPKAGTEAGLGWRDRL
ncbi:MAG TPA: TIM barrel protein [Devosiaceae bacterium]